MVNDRQTRSSRRGQRAQHLVSSWLSWQPPYEAHSVQVQLLRLLTASLPAYQQGVGIGWDHRVKAAASTIPGPELDRLAGFWLRTHFECACVSSISRLSTAARTVRAQGSSPSVTRPKLHETRLMRRMYCPCRGSHCRCLFSIRSYPTGHRPHNPTGHSTKQLSTSQRADCVGTSL